MATIARKKLDVERAERVALYGNVAYSEIIADGMLIPVASTSKPAIDSVNAHQPKARGGVRMTIISLRRVRCLEKDDD